MIQTIEATVDTLGNVHLGRPIRISGLRRAFVTILDEPPVAHEMLILSEEALAKDWNRPEKHEAWVRLSTTDIQHDLDDLFGQWTEDEFQFIEQRLLEQRGIDTKLWQ